MKYSKFLDKCIGVCAPSDGKSDKLDLVRLDNAYLKLNELGVSVVESSSVRNSVRGKSASDKERANELVGLFLDEAVDVIVSASGGEFLLEILPYIDFSVIKNNPKWFCGYSDNTGIGFVLATMCDVASIYSDNISCFGMDKWHDSVNNFFNILKGNIVKQSSFSKYQKGYLEYRTGLEGYNLDSNVMWRRLDGESDIEISGRFIGGCLDILLSLCGTKYDNVKEFNNKYKNDGVIWFLESCELCCEDVIRGLWQLREAGWFDNACGFVFGRPIINQSSYDISYDEAIMEILGGMNVPIIVDCDFGHTSPRMTLINGGYATINYSNNRGNISFILK